MKTAIIHQPSLFDIPSVAAKLVELPPTTMPKVEINQPLANKIDSFYSEDVQSKRMTQKEKVFYAIQLLQPCSDAMISAFTGIARHLIPDRRKSLGDKIEVSHSAKDAETNKTVTFYKKGGQYET